MPNFSGMWTSRQQMQARGANTWPALPGAPTSVSATGGNAQATVSFTAPADTGYPAGIVSYTVISSPGGITATGASSPITVTGLSNYTAYTFTVIANNASGASPASAASNSVTPTDAGQQAYTTAGTYSWVVPSGVSNVSVVAIGGGGNAGYGSDTSQRGGGGGGGGALAYANNVSVTAGETLTVVVGSSGNLSRFSRGATNFVNAGGGGTGSGNIGGSGGTVSAGTGFAGGTGGTAVSDKTGGGAGGGGAGGYAGVGGNGGTANTGGSAGAGGGHYVGQNTVH